ncbi:DoxX family protein [Phytoactinopolyspora halotolerans]|uniref:DoxX family protein n=1 Tax=Phytoactinopolyspora halotolerans TaxID=1981512 RepID=A0A6L9S640_9ACTN|nr:DoxX family protein [Phytoactinopolyspora halotolerans]NEE00616.1 DoxX family protein [Phytoactinopolyspora halotolerans]
MSTTEQTPSGPTYIEEPAVARWLFGSNRAAWIWLIARLWLGWEWFQSGWSKVFGGDITLRFWDWGDQQYGLTGDGNIGWVRSSGDVDVGDSVAGFAQGAIEASEGPHPDVAYGWYVDFLEWVRDTAHPWLGPMVAIGELVIGVLLIVGLFTGIAAALGAVLNFSFVFAGSAGVNPAMILVSFLLILAWRNAGWYGLDRWALPLLGTPWFRGRLRSRRREQGAPEPEADSGEAQTPPS